MRKIDQDRYIPPVITGAPVVNHAGYDEACKDRDRLARELDDLRQRFERGETVPILPEGAVLQVVAVDASKATVSIGRVGDKTGGEG